MEFSGFIFSAEDSFSVQQRYQFITRAAQYFDQHGYQALWTPERHFQEFGGSFPNPSVLSAALSQATSRLHLRAGCVVLPHHHPVRVAEEWAMIDQLSNGRAGLGIASGWHKRDFVFFPENYQDRKAVTYKGIDDLRKLWAGESLEFKGVDGELTQVSVHPKPVQKELPMWLVSSSSPEVWKDAGRRGLNILSLLNNWEALESNIVAYRQAREEAGLDPALGVVTTAVHTFVGDSNAEVKALVETPMKQYLSEFVKATNDDKSISGAKERVVSKDEKSILLQAVFDDMFEKRAMFGTVEKCIAFAEKLQKVGTDEVACFVDFGLEFETVLAALPKLDEVKAAFQQVSKADAAPKVEQVARHSAKHPLSWYYERNTLNA
ncbi:MupA/Atu3671 family FMN-dependent luciferase-like monooxygenase [Teredinibacter turnerae]|uniref:MupA/Atu3671 family FMN-dependent luciferase-like monooxygenase n=1 Tax=Teredinibacter turnerae TaxID=2426 RepID=UPI000414A1E3|nr:MupA/Atu3671 family FMN-dependent luciferase-like monooxygenase [Teredinibacter turnerae]